MLAWVAGSDLSGLGPKENPCFGNTMCAGFSWDRVNFLHSSLYGAMFWIYGLGFERQ